MNTSVCNSMTLDQQYTLTDVRDGKQYTIARLKMNQAGTETKCWMTQNLALALSTDSSKLLTRWDTDLNSTKTWQPERNTATSLTTSTFPADSYNPYSYNPNNASYGYYYNWTAAIASNDSSSLTTKYSNAPNSICPKGWRLPKVYDGSASNVPNEFGKLLYAYSYISNVQPGDSQNAGWVNNGYTKIQSTPLSFALSGYVNSSSQVSSAGTYSDLWSSTVVGSTGAYYLGFFSPYVLPQNSGGRHDGYPVRCVLR